MPTPKVDFDLIDQYTGSLVSVGHRMFVTHLIEDDIEAHVANVLRYMEAPENAVIADLGCGIGEFERIAGPWRPDITWNMVNLSRKQLDLCPYGSQYRRFHVDACHTGLLSASQDVVLFHNAMVQMNSLDALREAARLVRLKGKVVLYELIRKTGTNAVWMGKLQGYVPYLSRMLTDAAAAGLRLDNIEPLELRKHPECVKIFTEAGVQHELDYVQPHLITLRRQI